MLPAGKGIKNRGFLLLEIMISVSILSFGLLLVLNSFLRPIRAMQFSMDHFRAGLLLEEKMMEIYNSDLQEGREEGKFEDFDNKFSWGVDAMKQEDDLCWKVDLSVSWSERDNKKDLSVSTYI